MKLFSRTLIENGLVVCREKIELKLFTKKNSIPDECNKEYFDTSISIDQTNGNLSAWKQEITKNFIYLLVIIIIHYFFIVPIAIYYIIKNISKSYLQILLILLCFLPITGGLTSIIIIGICLNKTK